MNGGDGEKFILLIENSLKDFPDQAIIIKDKDSDGG
jgi:hypothetical protein